MENVDCTFWKTLKKGAETKKLRFPKTSLKSELYVIALFALSKCCEKLKKLGWEEEFV